MPSTEMPLTLEESDRLTIAGGTPRYMAVLGIRLLAYAVLGWLLLLIATSPVLIVAWLGSATAFGIIVIVTLLFGGRLGTVLLRYDFKLKGAELSGVRRGSESSRQFWTLFGLSAGGLNVLLAGVVLVGAVVAMFAPPIVALVAAFGVLVGNELLRRRFDMSLSILGVRLTAAAVTRVRSLSAIERRELTQLAEGAEWLASGFTMFGTPDLDAVQG